MEVDGLRGLRVGGSTSMGGIAAVPLGFLMRYLN